MTFRLPFAIKLLPALAVAAALGGFAPSAHADAPSLQVAPLQYTDSLTAGRVSSGYVDVSNPADSPVQITSSVRGFRQTGTNGELQFFDDPDLTAGIKVDLDSFTLGPREAVRVVFSVDPSKLPQGGIYAAVFFRTNPVNQANTAGGAFVVQSANVGTLLILTNGGPGAHRGSITGLSVPFWQFGSGLRGGDLTYKNTDTSKVAVAFKPALAATVLPWGRAAKFTTGLVLPGATRRFDFDRPGSYFGFLPVTVSDSDTGHHATVWVFAYTGAYLWLVPVLIVLFILVVVGFRKRIIRLPRVQMPKFQAPKPAPIIAPVEQPLEPAITDTIEQAEPDEQVEAIEQVEAPAPDAVTEVISSPAESESEPKVHKVKTTKVHKVKLSQVHKVNVKPAPKSKSKSKLKPKRP